MGDPGPSPDQPRRPRVRDADPFELPDWLGTGPVVWTPATAIASGHLVAGRLTDAAGAQQVACDLFAVDDAYPQPVAGEDLRHTVHQAWRLGQVHLGWRGERLTLMTPGIAFDADLVLEVIRRLACAVAARPDHYSVHLRLGG